MTPVPAAVCAAYQHLHLHSQYSVLEVGDERIGLQYLAISGEINFRIGCTATSGPGVSVLPTTHLPLHFQYSTHRIEYIPLVKVKEQAVGLSSDKEPQITIEYMAMFVYQLM